MKSVPSSSSFWPYPRLVAHRAGGLLAPENTLAAFETAVRLGCKAIETDVMMTADGGLILSHDEELGRAVDASGSVAALTMEELSKFDAGVLFGKKWQGQRMMTFDAALNFCAQHGIFMNIEIKPAAGFEIQTGKAVACALSAFQVKHPRTDAYLMSSFSYEALESFKSVDDKTPVGWLWEDIPLNWKEKARELGVKTIHPDEKTVTVSLVRDVHAEGWGMMAYTVDDAVRAQELLEMGVDALCTNRPDILGPVMTA